MEQTVCIRCGKMRIFKETWKDRKDNRGNVVTHSKSVCPDEACQKEVDDFFAAIRKKKEETEEKRQAAILKKKTAKKAP